MLAPVAKVELPAVCLMPDGVVPSKIIRLVRMKQDMNDSKKRTNEFGATSRLNGGSFAAEQAGPVRVDDVVSLLGATGAGSV